MVCTESCNFEDTIFENVVESILFGLNAILPLSATNKDKITKSSLVSPIATYYPKTCKSGRWGNFVRAVAIRMHFSWARADITVTLDKSLLFNTSLGRLRHDTGLGLIEAQLF